jgi:hypothetical protein
VLLIGTIATSGLRGKQTALARRAHQGITPQTQRALLRGAMHGVSVAWRGGLSRHNTATNGDYYPLPYEPPKNTPPAGFGGAMHTCICSPSGVELKPAYNVVAAPQLP